MVKVAFINKYANDVENIYKNDLTRRFYNVSIVNELSDVKGVDVDTFDSLRDLSREVENYDYLLLDDPSELDAVNLPENLVKIILTSLNLDVLKEITPHLFKRHPLGSRSYQDVLDNIKKIIQEGRDSNGRRN